MAEAARDEFCRDSRIACVLDARERSLHCHHEKLVVVDDEVAFVCGIDMTALSGDRYDDHRIHPGAGSVGTMPRSSCADRWSPTSRRISPPDGPKLPRR